MKMKKEKLHLVSIVTTCNSIFLKKRTFLFYSANFINSTPVCDKISLLNILIN